MNKEQIQKLSNLYQQTNDIAQEKFFCQETIKIYPHWDWPINKLKELEPQTSSINFNQYPIAILEQEKKILHNAIVQYDPPWNYALLRMDQIKNPTAKRIAFCFRTYDNLNQPKIWEEFFSQANPDQYIIRVIAKNPEQITQSILLDNLCPYAYGPTQYAYISHVYVTLKLFENAFKHPEVYKAINLTNSCIPIQPFKTIYKELTAHDKGLMLMGEDPTNKTWGGYYEDLIDKTFIKRENWHFNGPYGMVFTKKISDFFKAHDHTDIFKKIFASDERYFSNVIAHHNRFDLIERLQTHQFSCATGPSGNGCPYNEEFIQQAKASSILFFRKISPDSSVNLDIIRS